MGLISKRGAHKSRDDRSMRYRFQKTEPEIEKRGMFGRGRWQTEVPRRDGVRLCCTDEMTRDQVALALFPRGLSASTWTWTWDSRDAFACFSSPLSLSCFSSRLILAQTMLAQVALLIAKALAALLASLLLLVILNVLKQVVRCPVPSLQFALATEPRSFLSPLVQITPRDPTLPPLVFHYVPIIGCAVSYGMDPLGFLENCRQAVSCPFTRVSPFSSPKGVALYS